MDKRFIRRLCGEFTQEYYQQADTHFRHVVRNELAEAQTEIELGRLADAEACYARIKIYIKALRELPRFRERELQLCIPQECDSYDRTSIEEYVAEAYVVLKEKSEE